MNLGNQHLKVVQLVATGIVVKVVATKTIDRGIAPTPNQIDIICELVDMLHESGRHSLAHEYDDLTCQWSELLLDKPA
ncbi:hypothetical protein [Pseudoalteromonas luteoviolacea]|uniref:Uncharacterized protein n=1 Tax=Pseudoalteromonas luteoviolacea NCIMB 1942 TaxID=1365253 RepID=A0A167B0C3_9GAMM|nr:hypothetical protein [Pseudoalteromonas luteoviolacea]KZN46011.1 hypothetical protein N482_13130 [Pseudoalteromonas luteoviolacea NCIMB 1942]